MVYRTLKKKEKKSLQKQRDFVTKFKGKEYNLFFKMETERTNNKKVNTKCQLC